MVPLRHGDVFVRVHGARPEAAEQVVLLLHGMSWFSFTFDFLAPALASALGRGASVVCFDAYGRGRSAIPTLDYSVDDFVQQVEDLCEALAIGPTRRIALVGHSLGGATAATFAARWPERVSRLVLLNPAGTPIAMPLLGRLVRTPVLGSVLMWLGGQRMALAKLRADRCAADLRHAAAMPELVDGIIARLAYSIERPGWVAALHATLCNYPMDDREGVYRALAAANVATHVIWGEDDQVISTANLDLLRAWMPHAAVCTIADAGHSGFLERPEAFHPAVCRALGAEPSLLRGENAVP